MRDNSALEALVQALRRLPGVGQRSASRMAYHLLQHDPEGAQLLAKTLLNAVEAVKHCQRCHTLTEFEICATCQDTQRDATRLCVVETPSDQSALERTLAYQGLYFVLMGKLSPIEGVGPNDIGMQNRSIQGASQYQQQFEPHANLEQINIPFQSHSIQTQLPRHPHDNEAF